MVLLYCCTPLPKAPIVILKVAFFVVFTVLLIWQVHKCTLKPCFTYKTILVMAFQQSGVLFPFSPLRRQLTITRAHLHLVFGRASLQRIKKVQLSVFM